MKIRTNRITVSAVWIATVLGVSLLTGASLTRSEEPTQAASAAPQAAADAHSEFPAGPGRDVTLATCSKCHAPTNILAMGRDRQGWQDLILKMVDLGAQGSDEDFASILDYLTASFPPTTRVNVNTATAPQIATALALTPEESKAIVDYRDKNGKFKTLDDLKLVPAVDPKKLDAKKAAIAF